MAIITLLSSINKLRVVQVGANDGAVNDPIYKLVAQFPERFQLLFIEPQESVIPHLEANYAFHTEHTIFNGAIGPEGAIRLYTVASEFWGCVDVPYANGWPEYRAPTGITSSSREHVHAWLYKFLTDKSRVDDAIREIVVPSAPLMSIMEKSGFQYPIDCLQVDAEGFDDAVIYNCNIEETAPRLINFEAVHIGETKYGELRNFLGNAGYKVWRYGDDALAILIGDRTFGKNGSIS